MTTGNQNQLPMGMAGPLNLTPQPSYTPPPVPFGYGQMQGMPALSRNPNYGVPSGIGSLLGGQNPMMAPQAGAFLSPQAPVSMRLPVLILLPVERFKPLLLEM